MALSYPKRDGYLFSHKSIVVQEGAELVSKALISCKVMGKVDGRKAVYGNGRKAVGLVRGQLVVEAELTFEGTSFNEYRSAHPQLLDEIHNFSYLWEEGSNRMGVQVQGFTFMDMELPSEGTDELQVALKGIALDILMSSNGGAFLSLVEGDAISATGEQGGAG